MNMKNIFLVFVSLILLNSIIFAQKSGKNIGGIGGQAVFDSVAQRFKIKSLEVNHYIDSNFQVSAF